MSLLSKIGLRERGSTLATLVLIGLILTLVIPVLSYFMTSILVAVLNGFTVINSDVMYIYTIHTINGDLELQVPRMNTEFTNTAMSIILPILIGFLQGLSRIEFIGAIIYIEIIRISLEMDTD